MFVRSIAVVASVLAFVLVSAAPAVAAGKGPSAPTNLRITASSDTSISLAWDPAKAGSTSNWWYCVQKEGQGCFRVDPPKTTFTMTGLLPNRTTTWTVVAIDRNGNRSAPSNAVTHTTPPDTTAPSPAPVLSLTSVFPTRISVAWTASKDNLSQVWYSLFVNGSPTIVDAIGLRGYPLLYLTPSTTYSFRVTARDAYGNTVESNVLSVTTPPVTDFTPPTAPTNLRLGFQSDPPEAWLNWDPSIDDTDPQSQILYEVYLNGVLTNDGVVGGLETVAFCRAPGSTEIVLRAVDTSGNRSGPSNPIQFPC